MINFAKCKNFNLSVNKKNNENQRFSVMKKKKNIFSFLLCGKKNH